MPGCRQCAAAVARLRRDAAPSLPSRPVKIIVGLPPEAGRTSLLACWAGLGADIRGRRRLGGQIDKAQPSPLCCDHFVFPRWLYGHDIVSQCVLSFLLHRSYSQQHRPLLRPSRLGRRNLTDQTSSWSKDFSLRTTKISLATRPRLYLRPLSHLVRMAAAWWPVFG